MPTLMPGAKWLPISLASGNYRLGGIDLSTVTMYSPHIAQSWGSPRTYFNTPRPGNESSAHGWLDVDGTDEQFVSLTDTAYAVGAWNTRVISWESAGWAGTPLTDLQLDGHARHVVSLRALGAPIELQVNHDDPNGTGVTPHCILGGGHTCPNSSDEMANRPGVIEAQYADIVARAVALEHPHPAPKPPEDETVNVMYVVKKGKDGKPTGPVFLSWGREARPVSTFADEEYVESLLGNKFVPGPTGATAPITDAAKQTRDVTLADNLAAFGVK